ncbi:hypothetical protein [Streptomyces sp. NPDC088812]
MATFPVGAVRTVGAVGAQLSAAETISLSLTAMNDSFIEASDAVSC